MAAPLPNLEFSILIQYVSADIGSGPFSCLYIDIELYEQLLRFRP